jgi:dTDP-4-amino-4,6-dideoxygalactose transaminase
MKTKGAIDELAVFGGTPAFDAPLYVGRPTIGDRTRLLGRIIDALDRRWLTNDGPFVREFERRIADLLDVKHCIATSNGTVALEIAARALGLAGEVIVPSLTFIATAHALQWQQITPVFCDVDPDTHTLDPARVETMITPRTTGIIGVHLWGRGCDIDGLQSVARRHNLKLMYDAAHAFGCSVNGRMIGGFGDAEVFSFHATKFLNTFEGGAVTTNDDALAATIRLMRNFGFAGFDNVTHVGTNGKMNEICAAMGLTGLDDIDAIIARNRQSYALYARELTGIRGLRLIAYDTSEKGNFQYVVVDIDEAETGVSRDALLSVLHAENVIARRYFFPGCHRMEPYRSLFPDAGSFLPVTNSLVQRLLCLPAGTAIDEATIVRVARIVRLVAANGSEIEERLRHVQGVGRLS